MEFLYNCSNTNKTTIDLNLVKAQKILSKMKKELAKQAKFNNLNCETIDKTTAKNIIENMSILKKSKETKLENINNYYKLELDMLKLKNLIFRKNGEIELDTILSQIDFLNNMKKFYQNYANGNDMRNKNIDKITESDLTELINEKSEGSFSSDKYLYYIVYNQEEINELVKKMNKELNILEEKRDRLNNITSVSIELFETTMDMIGL